MKWNILNNVEDQISVNSDDILKILLKNRDIKTKKEIDEFLNPISPIEFSAKDLEIDGKEVEKAVKRINNAIKDDESIIVWGDYDADGVCATAIIWETLYKLSKNVLPYIPERVSEGYGLNRESISKLKTQNPKLKLIITVDHGITAKEKIEYAKSLGIDVIVCDHHQIAKAKPKCIAVVHTDKICAAAIAWFLTKEILKDYSNHQLPITNHQLLITNYLDLVAIASIADLEPLVGINRSFVKFGLKVLNETKRVGLLSLFEESGLKKGQLGTYEVGYIIAPRLNAAGRMLHAFGSLRLICTNDQNKATELARKLGETNKDRQLLTEETSKHAIENSKLKTQNSKLLIVADKSYHEGIIGLVAGKLVEQFYRPAIVLSVGEIYSKASARSISGFNIIKAIRAQSDILVDAGGHPLAAGFTIETIKIELLKQRLIDYAEKEITEEMMQKTLKIDMPLLLSLLSFDLFELIQKMSPFGIGNPEPVFTSEVNLCDFRTVGNEGKHLKMTVVEQQSDKAAKFQSRTTKQQSFSAIAFNQGNLGSDLKVGKNLQIAYTLSLNEWNNQKNLELKIRDIKWQE